MLYRTIRHRDPALLLATTVLPILLVLFGNLLQDVAYALVDP